MGAVVEIRNKKDIEKLQREIDNKRKAVKEVQSPFKHRILRTLVNTSKGRVQNKL